MRKQCRRLCRRLCFNPCFSGYLCSGPNTASSPPANGGFNPCFSGYLCSGNCRILPLPSSLMVSILVFLDTSVPGSRSAYELATMLWFQSLFFWIPLFRVPSHQHHLSRLEFQSLFFWIPLFRVLLIRFGSMCCGVSILVFLDTSVPGFSFILLPWHLASFNPCFSGYLCSGME